MLVRNMTGMSNCSAYVTTDSDLFFLPKYQYFCLRWKVAFFSFL